MGRRGPRPAPSALKRGARVRADRTNPAEPVPPARTRTPRAPRSMGPEARLIWGRLAPPLFAAGVLTPLDVDVLATYCDLLVQLERARHMLDVGLLVTGRRDGLITNPAWRVYRDAAVLVRAYAVEFGLTPSARSVIRLPRSHRPALRAGAAEDR